MTTGTLQDYDRLIDGGFSEQQARALVDVVGAPGRTDPAVLNALEQILQRLDAQDQVLAMVVQEIGVLQQDVREIREEIGEARAERREIRAEMQVIEERVKMEGRVSRMINATLIALGAIAASMAAVFAG